MKLKKCMKRISAVLLAATIVVSGLPYQPKVNAEEFPDEILFPIKILDFRADNLFFEYAPSWSGGGHGDDFATLQSNGKGFVETNLEQDPDSIYYGLPVYKPEKVKRIAELTYQQLNYNDSAAKVLDAQYISGIINPISARNYIRKKEWVVLDAEDTGKYKEDYLNGHYGGIKHYTELSGSAVVTGANNSLQGYYVGYIGGTGNGTVTFKYFNEGDKGKYDIRIFAMSNEAGRAFKVTVGSANYTVPIGNTGSWDTPSQTAAYTLTDVPLEAGDNTIVFSGATTADAPNLDRIEISTKAAAAVDDTLLMGPLEAEESMYNNGANGSKVVNDANFHGGKYFQVGGWNNKNDYYRTFNWTQGAGTYDIWLYYTNSTNDNWSAFYVNDTEFNNGGSAYLTWKADESQPLIVSGAQLRNGQNRISLAGAWINFDYFEIHKHVDIGTNDPYGYPLGNYDESKAKYNVDRINNTTGAEEPDGIADYGWYDIETCFDYAYFVTAHMFKSHPTLNKPYGDYNNLVFRKVEGDDPFPYYEFMGDQHHKGAGDGLIYNPTNMSIRNGSNADVDTAAGEFRTTAGEMFIADRLTKDYPTIDTNTTTGTGSHNFHYTVRTHSRFVYKKGADQTFYFSGDDDVYVFINGQLLIDMGGAHEQQDGTFNLDDLADANPELDLKNGKAVDFDFFYVERHTTESNFYGKMNFKLANDEVSLQWPEDIMEMESKAIPYGWVVDLNYKFESNRELTTNKHIAFTDDLGNKIGYCNNNKLVFEDGIVLGDGIRLRDDKKLIITVTKDGKATPDVYTFEFGDTRNFTAAEKSDVAKFFRDTLELEQGDTVTIDGIIFDSSIREFDSYDATEDPRVKKLTFNTKAYYDMYMTMGGTNSIANTVAIPNYVNQQTTVNMLIGALTVSAKIEGLGENVDARKDLSAYGRFTLSRPETKDNPDTDEDERIVYTNQFNIAKGDNTIVFDAVVPEPPAANTIYEKALPRGRYKLNMDVDVLTGYDVSVEIRVNGETVADVKKGETVLADDGTTYTFDTLYLDLEPKIVNHEWVYPEVEYILKAVRKVNPLKDLT